MKRILVVDESRAVRETLGLLLGRDFAVVQRPPLPGNDLSLSDEQADLVVLGVPQGLAENRAAVGKIAARLSCPALLLVDSKASAGTWKELGERVECLVKPFNPYGLREKIDRLLALSAVTLSPSVSAAPGRGPVRRYLDFPYVSAATSALARKYALTTLPVLLTGEVGCGQEQIARAIHSANAKAGPWISAYAPGVDRGYLLKQMDRLLHGEAGAARRLTLFLSNLEALDPAAQASLLGFLEEEEEKGNQIWLLSSSQDDLLEKVYRREFSSPLYYRLATLTLHRPPLRDRLEDVPALAGALAREYGERLNLEKVDVSPDAVERLCNYLWFGNLSELETVIARTLAVQRKATIEASDLILGTGDEAVIVPAVLPPRPAAEERPLAEQKPAVPEKAEKQPPVVSNPAGNGYSPVSRASNGDSPNIKVLINELAHELKNPMVTIKTFTQLLGDRFDDAAFRVRFQETVGSDIERMDDLLEAMLDFSRFTHPAAGKISLYEHVRGALEEIVPDCIRKGATIRWGRKDEGAEVFADELQLRYAVKNMLRAVLAQVRPAAEIQIDVGGEGRVEVSYVPEGGRMSPLNQYLDISPSEAGDEAVPLRVLLAKILLERNGGGMKVSHLDGGKVRIQAELPVA
ncbi:MAG: sigma 54-interacting transcriptional regulator [Deltaproteobacteria bacterium]|nr:sigma 54-interacting transcriptional regulator [Deltaproteobacteria bacterium]